MFKPRTVVVPNPPPAISRAEIVVVARPDNVVVARYKLPPAFLNAHWALPALAERES